MEPPARLKCERSGALRRVGTLQADGWRRLRLATARSTATAEHLHVADDAIEQQVFASGEQRDRTEELRDQERRDDRRFADRDRDSDDDCRGGGVFQKVLLAGSDEEARLGAGVLRREREGETIRDTSDQLLQRTGGGCVVEANRLCRAAATFRRNCVRAVGAIERSVAHDLEQAVRAQPASGRLLPRVRAGAHEASVYVVLDGGGWAADSRVEQREHVVMIRVVSKRHDRRSEERRV